MAPFKYRDRIQRTDITLSVTNSSKAGIAGGGDPSTDMTQFTTTGKVSWYYSWGLSSVDTNLEFVPMLWGEKEVAQWANATDGINATISQRKPTAVLGMNEPQETGQSNLTAQQGAEMWTTYMEPLHAQGLRLGSPAPSSNPDGKTWLQDFFTICNGSCTVDFIALHYYDVNATAFAEYLTDFHNTFQRPIWVTEWACENFNGGPQCSNSAVVEFLNSTQSFMDAQDWVERYAWYGVLRNLGGINPDDAMLTSNGQITDLGKQYIGAEAPQTSGASTTGGLPGLPKSAGMLRLTSWVLVPIFFVACLL
ncbi:glycosyl hydrolase catalytic core-domain-containing protein [Mycena maculata]|uniref:Glycosyl hydrolase catalytic core-domain-containing protein n=1 Tax=Mycena maculata TaxID=230809 RepID=A0AAD7JVU3_9AGAR|nr:glycosyl hydrolase catalytic core-domain-containing protein [Mycena maculata]